MGDLTRVGELISKVIKSPDLLADAKIKGAWKSAVGETAALHARPFRLRKGVLIVCAKDSVWANQLSFMREELLRKLSAATSIDIKDIRFTCSGWAETEDAIGRSSEVRGPTGESNRAPYRRMR